MEALFGGSSTTSGWTLFDSNWEALHRHCVSHGITLIEQTDPQSALLKHVFTGSCVLGGINVSSNCRLACTEVLRSIQIQGEVVMILVDAILRPQSQCSTVQLADIARAIGLVASGAKVVRRKLVSMLEDYKSLTRGGLLSVGFAHGVTLQGNQDSMQDTLILHLSSGECALHACNNLPACASIMQTFVVGHYPRHVLALASYPLQYNIKGFCDAHHSTLADSLKLGIHSMEYCKYLDQGCWHEHLIFQIVPLDEKSKEHRYIEVQRVTIVGMTGATRIMDRVIVYGENRPSIDPDFDKSLATIIWPNKSDLPNIIGDLQNAVADL
ncbi:hypothetical protein EV363DRAFT_1295540 [Boletus edulis]|nr:hypothetical protein EV363DRAFT_1295540 [Boletus edulis]